MNDFGDYIFGFFLLIVSLAIGVIVYIVAYGTITEIDCMKNGGCYKPKSQIEMELK